MIVATVEMQLLVRQNRPCWYWDEPFDSGDFPGPEKRSRKRLDRLVVHKLLELLSLGENTHTHAKAVVLA